LSPTAQQQFARPGITPVIPSKAGRIVRRETAFALPRERDLIERFFRKLEGFRAIATGHDTLAGTFLAAIQLVFVPCGLA
jgi:putative transposase